LAAVADQLYLGALGSMLRLRPEPVRLETLAADGGESPRR
jgi:hypothetical protein